MRPWFLLSLVLLAACNSSPTEPSFPPESNSVTGRWSGAIRDEACGEGTMTMDIQQFQTEFGHFFYGNAQLSFPKDDGICNGSISVANGVVGESDISWMMSKYTTRVGLCYWTITAKRTSRDVMTGVHTRTCSLSRGGFSLARQ